MRNCGQIAQKRCYGGEALRSGHFFGSQIELDLGWRKEMTGNVDPAHVEIESARELSPRCKDLRNRGRQNGRLSVESELKACVVSTHEVQYGLPVGERGVMHVDIAQGAVGSNAIATADQSIGPPTVLSIPTFSARSSSMRDDVGRHPLTAAHRELLSAVQNTASSVGRLEKLAADSGDTPWSP